MRSTFSQRTNGMIQKSTPISKNTIFSHEPITEVHPKIVINSKTGFLPAPNSWQMEVQSFEPQPLAEKICFFYNHPEMIMQMGKHGRKITTEKFDLKKMRQNLRI